MSRKRILIVDDERPLLDLLNEILEGEGYLVDGAQNAGEALALVKDNLYDAAILDFALPDMNGLALHRRIREMDADLGQKTLFISGVSQSEESLGYYETDSAGFLPKPFNVWDVVSRIRKLTDGEST
jgi:DNA-binding response OmpR family regulator